MRQDVPNPVIHLELHTPNLGRACAWYVELFGWQAATIYAGSGSYTALKPGDRIGGGVVECEHPVWLPYVEVADIFAVTERASALGASVLLGPREGPAGWRAVLGTTVGGEIALWQPK
jgi:predicted enzyme related to lactoylglutathione lyase